MTQETAAFESIAGVYDQDFTWTLTGRNQRKIVWAYLDKTVPLRKLDVLELNCGTGEDAIWFARKRHRVIATDQSGSMIMVAESKRIISGYSNLRFLRSSMQDLKKRLPARGFDLVFSNFGGLNCVSRLDLARLSQVLSGMLKPGGRVVFVLMGRKCIWERLYFFWRGEKQKMFRRLSPAGILTKAGGEDMVISYYSPSEIATIFRSDFRVVRKRPVGLFIPPSYMEHVVGKRRVLFKFLLFMEWCFGWIPWMSDRSDHYLIELERRED